MYQDWETGMDHYFEWCDMSEARKIRCAKMKLLGQAKTYWLNVECLVAARREEPIETWDEMKHKLQEKYLPSSYKRPHPVTLDVEWFHPLPPYRQPVTPQMEQPMWSSPIPQPPTPKVADLPHLTP